MLYYAAPMEGFTDRVWRQTHQKWFGAQGAADLYYAPFISPPENRVLIKKKMAELAPEANPGAPVIPQLLAKDGELAAWMIGQLRALGYTEVNLNLGCPAGTVTAKGKGSGMLRDLAKVDAFLDGVFSHTGADSIYFNKFGRYPTPGAYQSEKSPYYSWYHFWGNKEYESWWGIDTLPNVDENNPSYTKYICGDDGVLDYWLSLGAAGYRLDVADELPDEFLDNLRACVKKFDEEKIVIGEVWEDASNKEAYGVKRRYLLGDQLDSVMNYPFREAIIAYMKGEAATTFRDRIMGILENYPKCTVDVLMNFVSTHDIERAINRFGGQPCDDKSKDWMASNELSPEEYERGKTLLKGAMVLQFFLPGVPSIYYGDEAGLQGWKDPFNRRCYPWGQEDTELIDYTRQLAKIRREHPAFAEGAMEFLVLEDNVVGFARYIPENGSSAVILLNRSGNTAMVSLRDKAFGRYAFSTVISGICDGDAVILPKNSYAVISAVRTNVPNAR